jgi:hypothetical protein
VSTTRLLSWYLTCNRSLHTTSCESHLACLETLTVLPPIWHAHKACHLCARFCPSPSGDQANFSKVPATRTAHKPARGNATTQSADVTSQYQYSYTNFTQLWYVLLILALDGVIVFTTIQSTSKLLRAKFTPPFSLILRAHSLTAAQ